MRYRFTREENVKNLEYWKSKLKYYSSRKGFLINDEQEEYNSFLINDAKKNIEYYEKMLDKKPKIKEYVRGM